MPTLHERIRRARALAGLTQHELASRLGVHRGAVTQWEHPDGSAPNMSHLIAIAVHTGVNLEWLGTGRGTPRVQPADDPGDPDDWERLAIDAVELECLRALRRMPRRMRERVVGLLRTMAP